MAMESLKILLITLLITLITDNTSSQTFHNPIFTESWPDPYCYLHSDGFYYMPRRQDDRRGIELYRSPILSNWRNASMVIALRAPEGLMSLWAPELHFLNGSFYLYFAMDNGDNRNHRMYVSRALDSGDLMRSGWTTPKRIQVGGGDEEDVWAIDATVLEWEGHGYLIWSGWPTINAEFPQNIYIGRFCEGSFEEICGGRVLLAEPEFDWEKRGAALLEGPQVLKKGGKLFLIYSGSASWTADYCLGMMRFWGREGEGVEVMRRENWWKGGEPVFWRNDWEGVFGVGHASFTRDKRGEEEWVVYHGMENVDNGWDNRTARVQRWQWDEGMGIPVFPRPRGLEQNIDLPRGEYKIFNN